VACPVPGQTGVVVDFDVLKSHAPVKSNGGLVRGRRDQEEEPLSRLPGTVNAGLRQCCPQPPLSESRSDVETFEFASPILEISEGNASRGGVPFPSQLQFAFGQLILLRKTGKLLPEVPPNHVSNLGNEGLNVLAILLEKLAPCTEGRRGGRRRNRKFSSHGPAYLVARGGDLG
jgi:hypothetical protein